MDTLFSADNSPYQSWQSRLLAHTFHRVGQPGSLICLLSTKPGPTVSTFKGTVFPSRDLSIHPLTGDIYPPYNKPAALCDYFSSLPISDMTYLLLDPDMVFVRSWAPVVTAVRGIGEDTLYMEPRSTIGATVIRRHCRRHPDRVQAVGFPVVIHEEPLRAIVDRWYLLTEGMRSDPATRALVGWVCEMWAFTIAAAEAGVQFQVERNCSFLHDDLDTPLIHYTYPLRTPSGFHWDKRDHIDGVDLPPLRPDVPVAGRVFHRIVQDYHKERRDDPLLRPVP